MLKKIDVMVHDAGARGHALIKMAQRSGLVGKIHTTLRNVSTQRDKSVTIAHLPKGQGEIDNFVQYCGSRGIGLVLIGPENPLADGMADALRKAEILVFGPEQAAAKLESDKLFGREFCKEFGLPHPDYQHCINQLAATAALDNFEAPYVIKLTGLEGGKGVTIHKTKAEAAARLEEIYAKDAQAGLLLEEFLPDHPDMTRSELSVHVIISLDGSYQILPTAQDYKQRKNGDKGKMTGGMGGYSPVPQIEMNIIEATIIKPMIAGLKARGLKYGGVLYLGLKKCPAGYFVVEFNVRFGDPEICLLAEMIESDLVAVMLAAAKGEDISGYETEVYDGAVVGIVVVDAQYPNGKSDPMRLPAHLDTDSTFHAATYLEDEQMMAHGGRILVVTARGMNIDAARSEAYRLIGLGPMPGFAVRNDIAADVRMAA